MAFPTSGNRKLYLTGLCAILVVGAFLRLPGPIFSGNDAPLRSLAAIHPAAKFNQIGFDEGLYRTYVNQLIATGLTSYPEIVDHYLEVQKRCPVPFCHPFAFSTSSRRISGTNSSARKRSPPSTQSRRSSAS